MNTIQTYNLSVFISCVILCRLFAAAFTGHAFENPRFFRKRLRRLNFKKIRGCCFAQIVVLFFCRHIDTATKLCREQGITVVLITHHMEECVGADRVIVLSNGAVVADGAPKQVFSQVDLLKREGLTAPVTVRLLHALRAHGMDVPLDALTVSDCADAVAAALKP